MGGQPVEVTATDGSRLHVVVHGAGPTVVLLHGLACTGAIWDDVVVRLEGTHRVIVPDLRGHGASVPVSGRPGRFDLAQQADDIRSVLEALDVRDAVLVGHSAGGYATLDAASRHPELMRERARRIVVVGTAGSLTHLRERAVLRFAASRAFYRLLGSPTLGRQVVRRGAFGRGPRPEWIEASRVMALACPRPTKAAWVRAISGTSVQDRLDVQTATPVTVVIGSLDTAATPARAAELAEACGPQGGLEILDGAGHMAPVERPEQIADLIRSRGG